MCMNKSHTWHLMPAKLHAQVSGSQNPWQSHPQASLETRRAWSCLFSSLSIRFTPAAWRRACLCLGEYGLRTPPSSNSASLMWMTLSSSGTWSTVSLSASCWSVAPLVINWNQNKKDKIRRYFIFYTSNENKWRNQLTLCLKALNFSSLSPSCSLILHLCCCSSACSATVYLWMVLCLWTMPRVAPPRLGTLVKPWQRGKLNTVTRSKRTLLCVPLSLGLFRMGRTGGVRKGHRAHKEKLITVRCSFKWNTRCFNRWHYITIHCESSSMSVRAESIMCFTPNWSNS